MKRADFDKEYQRNCALARITQITRHGTVEGVHFDLRHVDSNPDEWVMEPLGAATPGGRPSRSSRSPFIWFPWFGTFDPTVLKEEVESEFHSNNRSTADWLAKHKIEQTEIAEYDKPTKLPKAWIKSEIKKRTPDAIVKPGDTIATSNVKVFALDDHFRHKHDKEFRCLFVDIVNSGGTRKKLVDPIILVGRFNISLLSPHKNLAESIRERIMRHYNLSMLSSEEILKITPGFVTKTTGEAALIQCMAIYERTIPSLRKDQDEECLWDEEWAYLRALDDGCKLGYYWASAEAELNMKPLAIAGLKSREGAKTAGEKSGASRRSIADTTWKPHALELAKGVREGNPALSQQDVATEIAMLWKLKIPTPGHSTLKAFIANLEKTGTLARATKSKRG